MSDCKHDDYYLGKEQWIFCSNCKKKLYHFTDIVDHCLLRDEAEEKVRELEESNQHLVEAIQFTLETDCPLEFLRCWNEGNFEAIKEEWPEFNGYLGEKGE